jgi:NADPH:quinone reductase-like Zn-dependent oxidoreductase
MRQAWLTQKREFPAFTLRQATDPIPANGEVRIRVEACGISRLDLPGGGVPVPELPFVPGYDVAGTIDAVGQGVAQLSEGDPVFALATGGGYADVVCLNHRRVFRRLDWMNARDAAALPADFLTAYQALITMGAMDAGQRVLIAGADDSLGLAALELCRLRGATALATAPVHRHEGLRERGAAHAIDPTRVNLADAVREAAGALDLDLVLLRDPGQWRTYYPLLGPSGRLLCLPGPSRRWRWLGRLRPALTIERILQDNRGLLGLLPAPFFPDIDRQRAWMQAIVDLYDEARFRPAIDRTFPLDAAAAAHVYLAQQEGFGKVLLLT